MKILIEYKSTTNSKFTFTKDEVRIKIADDDRPLEVFLTSKAGFLYDALLIAGWGGVTLRCKANRWTHKVRLMDNNKKVIAIFENNAIKLVSQ